VSRAAYVGCGDAPGTPPMHRTRFAPVCSSLRVAPLCSSLLVWLACTLAGCSDEAAFAPSNDDAIAYREPAGDDRWTLVVLPDTQDYAEYAPEILHAQVDWILQEQSALDIRMVVHVGDIVNLDVPEQWQNARDALGKLEQRVPLLFAPGNHDYVENTTARTSMLASYFDPRGYFAGNEGGSYDASGWNNYQIVKSPSRDWLFIALEFAPRAEVLVWADQVMASHPDLDKVFATHAYLYSDGTRYDYESFGDDQEWNPFEYPLDPTNKHDGEQIWQQLLRKQPSLRFVLCGHVLGDGVGRLSSTGDAGNRVQQLLANYQMLVDGQDVQGTEGFLRVMTFSEGDSQVAIRTYSPWLDEEREDDQNRFGYEIRR
jgi:hypothetical protein